MRSWITLPVLVTCALAATADDWRNRTIYQLVTDRFATSDESGPKCDTSNRQYCGGTWKGVISKLDYIQDLGFDAIWISPVVANVEGNTSYGEAFHGYWTQELDSLNDHFGGDEDLKALSTALHNRSMYLMVDVVANHMASSSDPPEYSALSPFSSKSSFHSECFISNWDNQTEIEQCWLGDTNLPLADLNTEDDEVVKTLYAWIQKLVGEYGIDGVRIDTVKHIRKDFWPDFVKSAGVFTLGEIEQNDVNYVAPYTQILDSVLDYPTWFALVSAFQNATGNLTALASNVWAAQAAYKSGEMMTGSFLENHDQPRFGSLTDDQALVKNAMAWPFVQDGIPILYYGQEQGYQGGPDPANREALWLSGYIQDKPLVTHVKILNAARRAAITANSSYLTTPVRPFPRFHISSPTYIWHINRVQAKLYAVTPSTLAVSKPPMLALLTNTGYASDGPTWNVPDAGYAPHEELVDVLTCNTVYADTHGGVLVHGSHGLPQILLPPSALSPNGSLCSNMGTAGRQASSGSSGPRPHTSKVIADAMTIGLALALAFIASHSSLLVR
ncbi:glycoside hydrolase family 13 protein [Fomes fomentarius]|nr:glycoside hydrolase family 13 protein [Fomes fomentarius]